jgi:hypothetical protein
VVGLAVAVAWVPVEFVDVVVDVPVLVWLAA